jgi:hypothetical protein
MNQQTGSRRVARHIGAVAAGVLAVVILSTVTDLALRAAGVFPPLSQPMSDGQFLLAIAHRLVYAALGGCIAARLAPTRPLRHAVVLGIIGSVVPLAGAIATWNAGPAFGPHWYPLILAATAIPCAWVGGRLFAGPGPASLPPSMNAAAWRA